MGLIFVVSTVLFGRTDIAHAQQTTYTPTRTQITLIQKGAKATRAGQYDVALRHYQEALRQGPFNLARLGMGRALQKSGDCQGALAQFKAARTAPQVAAPSPAQIEERLNTFTSELKAICPAVLLVECSPLGVSVTLGERVIVCGELTEQPPGTYQLRANQGAQQETRDITLTALERTEIVFRFETIAPQRSQAITMGQETASALLYSATTTAVRSAADVSMPPPPSNTQQFWGWGLVGLGGVGLATGAVFTGLVFKNGDDANTLAEQNVIDGQKGRELIQDGETYTTAQYIGYGIGAALVISGVLLIFLDETSDPQPATTQILTPVLKHNSVDLQIRF